MPKCGVIVRFHVGENSSRKVIQSLQTVRADNLAFIGLLGNLSCGNKSAYVLTILLPFLNLSNPLVFPSSDDVHSPFGGEALKQTKIINRLIVIFPEFNVHETN